MEYTIITNNNKVFNFYQETDQVIFLEFSSFKEILHFIKNRCDEGYRLLSDPILYNLENKDNPFKTILISRSILSDNSHSINLINGVLDIAKNIEFTPINKLNEVELEEFRFIDLNLIRDSIDKIVF